MPVISMFYGIVIEIHRDELVANWKLASEGDTIYKIEPLK